MNRSEANEIAANEPRFAILLLTHSWDVFTERQLGRLQSVAGTGDVYVIMDETRGAAPRDVHQNSLVSVSEAIFAEHGFIMEPQGQAMWLNADYALYYFETLHRNKYDFIFLVEYDCLVTISIRLLVDAMVEAEAEFIGMPMRDLLEHWYWTRTASHYYPPEHICGRLMGITGYSAKLVQVLGIERRSLRLRDRLSKFPAGGTQIPWLNNEVFIGSELKRLGVRELALNDYADTSLYNWFPPSLESISNTICADTIVHPFLDDTRYVSSILKYGSPLAEIFRDDSPLWTRVGSCPRSAIINMFRMRLLEDGDARRLDELQCFP